MTPLFMAYSSRQRASLPSSRRAIEESESPARTVYMSCAAVGAGPEAGAAGTALWAADAGVGVYGEWGAAAGFGGTGAAFGGAAAAIRSAAALVAETPSLYFDA